MTLRNSEKHFMIKFLNKYSIEDYHFKFKKSAYYSTPRFLHSLDLVKKWMKVFGYQPITFDFLEKHENRPTYQTLHFKRVVLQLTGLYLTAGGQAGHDLDFTTDGLRKKGPEHLQRFLVKKAGYTGYPFYNIYVSRPGYLSIKKHVAHDLLSLKKPFFADTKTTSLRRAFMTELRNFVQQEIRTEARLRGYERRLRYYYYYICIAPYTRDSFDQYLQNLLMRRKYFLLRLRNFKLYFDRLHRQALRRKKQRRRLARIAKKKMSETLQTKPHP